MSLFPIRLKSLRRRKGQTQKEVADWLGVARTNYGAYERGDIVPPYAKIRKLADYFGVSVEYLMGTSNFENYDTKVPDIVTQIKQISDELISETSAINIDGRIMTNEEKKKLQPLIKSCLILIEYMKEDK